MKRIIAVIMFAALSLLLFSGCTGLFEGTETNKKIPTYYTKSPVVAARYYWKAFDEENQTDYIAASELPADKLEALVAALNGMELKHHSFHTDYFWGGRYGIELEYEDGTFMTYDGTKAEYRGVSVKDSMDSEARSSSDFLEVTNLEFWTEMKNFFPEIVPEDMASW